MKYSLEPRLDFALGWPTASQSRFSNAAMISNAMSSTLAVVPEIQGGDALKASLFVPIFPLLRIHLSASQGQADTPH